MSGLHHSVISAFAVPGIVKEKGYYKTRDGTRMIRKTKDTAGQISARHHIIEHCIKAGYPWIDRYHLTQFGQPYIFADAENHIMLDLIPHREADFTDAQEFIMVVEAVARWHACARDLALPSALHIGRPPVPLTDSFRTQAETLTAIHKRIRRQSKWSDFDVLFLKSYHEYKERMHRARQLLESTNYLKRWQKARQMNHICHGGLKEECLRIHKDKVYITKLEQATVDYQLNDLCSLIRRREKLDKDVQQIDRNTIYKAYSKILHTEPEEEVILEAMLLYPLAFVKIVLEYYQKKRSWTPVAMANKMREILGTQ